jgi:hypothetical protein
MGEQGRMSAVKPTLYMADLRGFCKIQRLFANRQNGARGRNRTADTMIFSHVLYQLSYPGIAAAAVPIRRASDWKRAL